MRHRAGLFRNLRGAQRTHLLSPRHRVRIHVAGVLLFPKDGQPFLERQLKPVAACDPVSGPVVEILVRDGPVDEAKIEVGGDIGRASTSLVLKTLRPLFSMAPALKSPTATTLYWSRSTSSP